MYLAVYLFNTEIKTSCFNNLLTNSIFLLKFIKIIGGREVKASLNYFYFNINKKGKKLLSLIEFKVLFSFTSAFASPCWTQGKFLPDTIEGHKINFIRPEIIEKAREQATEPSDWASPCLPFLSLPSVNARI